ncbi:trimeric autotransporter adhesin EhaG [Paraburkholderia jirisanensis]
MTNSFVAYDDATKSAITLAGGAAGTKIKNVAAGDLSAASTDAVNGSQLYATNQNVDSLNTQITNINGQLADAVMYDSSAHDKVTLAGGTSGTTITNVKAGAVGATSMDAINGSQLYNTASSTAEALGGGSSVDADGKVRKPSYNVAGNTYSDVGTALAAVDAKAASGSVDGIKYDTSAHDKVTFSGASGTKLSNVMAGTADMDAVNLAQLKAAGLNVDTSGNVTNSFVAYDDSTMGKVTLAGGTAGTTITNVKAGAVGAASTDAINGSQLYNTASSTAAALGGGSSVNADGTIKTPSYTIQGQTKTDVGSALAAIDTATTGNTTSITNLTNDINNGEIGLVQQDAASRTITVARSTDGTTVDFTGIAGARQLKGVSAGQADTDAVNLAQLKAAGLNVDTSGNVTNSFVAYDDATMGKVTLAGGSAGTTITNVKAGAISAASMDAINGSQLYNTASSTAEALGGGSSVDADGKIRKPSYNVAGNTYGDVGSALAAVDAKAASGSVDGVKYDTSAHDSVTFDGASGTKLSNVTAGTADMDAVNLAQLKAAGLNVDTSGNVTNSFVAYDDATKGAITLAGGAAGTKIENVKAGELSATSTDAVNGAQLFATNQNVDSLNTQITTINGELSDAVKYDSSAHDKVTFNRIGGTTLSNVKAGAADMDAVNVSQLKAAGLNVDTSGNVTNSFVAYDDAAKGKVTLAGGTNGTTITNVKAGVVGATSADAINGSQLYTLASSETKALGGGSTVNPDGSISMPEYTVGGKTVDGVDGAVTALDTRITGMSSAIVEIAPKLKYIKFGDTNALDATAAGADAVAIGGFAQAMGDGALAIGANARAMATNSVAIGFGSSTSQANTFAVGSTTSKRRIVNLADGTSISDAVTVGQMNTAIGAAIVNNGVKNNGMLGASTMMLGATASSKTPDQLIVSGPTTLSTATDALGNNAVAMGLNAHANAANAVAAGQNISVLGANGVAVGQNVAISSDSAVGIGSTVSVASINSVAIGSNGTEVNTGSDNAVAIGSNVSVGGKNTVAIGSNIITGTAGSVVLGANSSDDNRANTVSVGSSAVPSMGTSLVRRQVINVAAGTQDFDAVNVSQLKGVTSALGGGATVNADGSVKKPSYNVAGSTFTDVGAALAAVDAKAATGSIDGITYDSSAHDKVTFNGASGTTLAGVKAGAVGATSTEAINGSQLYNTASSTAAALGGGSSVNADGTVNKPSYNVAGNTFTDVGAALAAVDAKAATGSVDGITYDTSAHDKVTFNGANGTILSNVNAGVADKDAVNVAQLKAAGLNVDTSGNVTNAFVSYDDAAKSQISLGGATGTKIANVQAGNVNATSMDAINGSQLYNVASSTAAALGGGSTVNTDGTITAPTFALNEGSTTVHTVGDAITNIDGRVTQNTGDITNIKNKLVDGGVIDGTTGETLAVVYDSTAKDSVTFGGKGATAPVALHNVAAGELSATSADAVNGSQLYATNKRIDDINYNTGNIGDVVMYDSSKHDTITLGGMAGGTMTAPVTLTNVADGKKQYDAVNFGQLSALQGQVTNLDNRVTVVEGQVINQGGGGSSWNNDAGGNKITNVAAGTETTDAVNVGQLNEAVAGANSYTDARIGDLPNGMSSKDYTDQRINSVQSQVNSVAKSAYSGIAAATALTMIPDVDQGKTIAVGVGTGNYKGYQAVALGASVRITQNLKAKIGGSVAPGNGTAIGAGASYQW